MVRSSRMMFGEIIGSIRLTLAPINLKLALANPIADPIKTHIDCFGPPFLFDSAGCDAVGSIVVSGHGSCGLGVSHFFKSNAQRASFLAIVEQGSKFGFCGTGKDFAHDVA
jgi:hypothetical protein